MPSRHRERHRRSISRRDADKSCAARRTRPVRQQRRAAQRRPVASVPGGKTKVAFVVRGGLRRTTNSLTLDADALPEDTTITVRTLSRIVDGSQLDNLAASSTGSVWTQLEMKGATVAEIGGFELATNDLVTVEVTTDFSLNAEHLKKYPIIVTHLQEFEVAGRMTIEISVREGARGLGVRRPARTRELHVSSCPFWHQLRPRNKVPFQRFPMRGLVATTAAGSVCPNSTRTEVRRQRRRP